MKAKYRLIALCAAICIMALALAGCSGADSGSNDASSGSQDAGSSSSAEQNNEPAQPEAPAEITFDTPFEFDGLTITLGSGIQTATLENQFSDHDGATVIAIPISVTNNSDETKGLNMFYYKAFGPSGTQLEDVSSFFSDSNIGFAGDARPGATIESTMHVLYEDNGDYFIVFDNLIKDKVEVKLPIAL
ncbi:hypothetical protein [Raoultibacter phocaeensis]|uniref:hypothetical protein n=1 Tax=Raoultibacter phocaeensis TaxID=2479841 RepID=UPI001117B0DD|nr:hypothetical protein [Raoultibacter phocaeensis]